MSSTSPEPLRTVTQQSAVMKPFCAGLQRVLLQRMRDVVFFFAKTDTFSALKTAQFLSPL